MPAATDNVRNGEGPIRGVGQSQAITLSTTAVLTAPIKADTVSLISTVEAWIHLGPAPLRTVTAATGTRLLANYPYQFPCAFGDRISAIAGGAGQLTVSPFYQVQATQEDFVPPPDPDPLAIVSPAENTAVVALTQIHVTGVEIPVYAHWEGGTPTLLFVNPPVNGIASLPAQSLNGWPPASGSRKLTLTDLTTTVERTYTIA